MSHDHFAISQFVRAALSRHRPVVALETTLVTHGLPQPHGVEIASELESEVVAAGATPATIGVLDGRVRVGLTLDELHRLDSSAAVKLNLSNFASESGDVSADLNALGRFPVAVVCAGAKAVLDLARTVEALESLGVPVYGLGTGDFPAFYLRESGLTVDERFDTIDDLAEAVRNHFQLGLGTGVVVANPIPREHELPRAEYESALARSLADAGELKVRGRLLTPFLLERLAELTAGGSVAANLALLRSNARVAAELAVALARS
jgi:pseudouridine-5'-phosphate glycosidase